MIRISPFEGISYYWEVIILRTVVLGYTFLENIPLVSSRGCSSPEESVCPSVEGQAGGHLQTIQFPVHGCSVFCCEVYLRHVLTFKVR